MSAINPSTTSKNNTTSAFLTALWVNAVLLTVEVGGFVILKQRLWRIYSPRTVLPPQEKRAQELPGGVWKWIPAVFRSPTEDIVEKNGLDAYMFLRFIRLLIIIFAVFTLLTFITVVPAVSVGIGTNTGLPRISWINITEDKDQIRFTTHVIVTWILTGFVLYMINREMLRFVHMRHQFLISKRHSRLAQARTVLVLPVPDELANEHDLRTFASFVPGGIDRVWLYRDTKELNKLFERRVDACKDLEAAESKILKKATLAWRKRQKQYKKTQKRKVKDEEVVDGPLELPPPSRELLNDLVPAIARPKHRTGFLGLFGPKVDTIDWCKEEVARLNAEIANSREHTSKGKFLGTAFIRCNLQLGAHVLAQCLSYHEPLKMYSKTMEAHPKDIVWRNIDDGALEMKTRYVTSWLATIGLIIAWAAPAAFVGTMSNLPELCGQYRWVEWLCRLSSTAQNFIQGVLPPLILMIFFALLPLALKALAWYECIPRYSLISISVYRRFYLFLLIHGFLITTLSSGITGTIEQIVQNPTDTVQQLASKLPASSIFFLTYMVTQGLAGSGSALVQLGPLILHYLRKWLLGRTPRQAYAVTFKMPSCDLGTTLPRFSLLATISFVYSVLSPFINLLATLSFIMFYLAFKFLFTQVFDQPDEKETGGMYFPMAINNLYVGLYIEHICLLCLLVLKAKSTEGEYRVAAVVQAVFILILIILTMFVHAFIHNSYSPMRTYLPMSLATKKMAQRYAKQKGQTGEETDDDIQLDLFSQSRTKRGVRTVRQRLKTTAKILEGKVEQTVGQLKSKVKGGPSSVDGHTDDEKNNSVAQDEAAAAAANITDLEKAIGESTAISRATMSEDTRVEKEPMKGHIEQIELTNRAVLSRQSSGSSGHSKASTSSKKSNKSNKSKKSNTSTTKRPVFDEAAPALRDEDDVEEDEEQDDHAFDHPSVYVNQAWVWIPKDTLGLSAVLAEELKSVGVYASDVGANMDGKGIVEVTRNPPDEEWSGGHDT